MNEVLTGFIACIISCIAFGFMFAPLRKYDCRDGFYIQWIQCAVVFFVGFVINCSTDFPNFNPIAMIGGALFATGNVASVPIINGLGIGVGMLIWGSIQVIVGWGVARFGLFGTRAQPVKSNLMNVIGLVMTLISGFMFVFVKHENQRKLDKSSKKAIHMVEKKLPPSAAQQRRASPTPLEIESKKDESTTVTVAANPLKLTAGKIALLGLSVFLGIFHGLMMTPIVYIQDNDPNAYDNVLNYLFAHFSTIFAFSSVYFLFYVLYKKNKPYTPSKLILPSIAYGILWCIGMVLFFISNHYLSQTVSFPITTRLPSTIGVLADVVLFKTIKGTKNLLYAFSAIAIGIGGVVLIALSNQV